MCGEQRVSYLNSVHWRYNSENYLLTWWNNSRDHSQRRLSYAILRFITIENIWKGTQIFCENLAQYIEKLGCMRYSGTGGGGTRSSPYRTWKINPKGWENFGIYGKISIGNWFSKILKPDFLGNLSFDTAMKRTIFLRQFFLFWRRRGHSGGGPLIKRPKTTCNVKARH